MSSNVQASSSRSVVPANSVIGTSPEFNEAQELYNIPNRSRLQSYKEYAAQLVSNNVGLFLIGTAQGFFALMNIAVKKLNTLDPPVPPLQLVVVRMGITWLCCLVYMIATKVPHPFLGPKGVRLLLVFRGCSGFVGLSCIYYALQYLSVSDATVLSFLSPFTTAIAAAVLLGEKYSKKQAFAGLFALVGVVLIARPVAIFGKRTSGLGNFIGTSPEGPTPAQRLIGVTAALLGVFGATGAYITIRAIGKRAHALHAMTAFSFQSTLFASVAMFFMGVPVVMPNKLEWLLLFALIGVFGFVAQFLLTLGLQREAVGRGTTAVYIQIVFAIFFEKVFFNTTPPLLSFAGAVIIISSAIYVAVTKDNVKKPAQATLVQPDAADAERGLLQDNERARSYHATENSK